MMNRHPVSAIGCISGWICTNDALLKNQHELIVFGILWQGPSLIKAKPLISISRSILKIILCGDSSLGDGFSPLGLITCTHLPFF